MGICNEFRQQSRNILAQQFIRGVIEDSRKFLIHGVDYADLVDVAWDGDD